MPMAFLSDVLTEALDELADEAFPLYTLAFYLDHASAAVSICADTLENSLRSLADMNDYSRPKLFEAVRAGDFERAALWRAHSRNLSLGDFAAVNVARTPLDDVGMTEELCQAMVLVMARHHTRIRGMAPDPSRVMLATSTLDAEIGLTWALPVDRR
ncbi:MAG: hypothetical protein AAF602_25405 [Myxococcota bacterium]